MSDLLSSLEALRERRSSRRSLLKTAVTGALGLAGAGLLAKGAEAAAVAPSPPGGLDAAILNFALNLEYLEATYYTYAAFGTDLSDTGIPVTSSSGAPSGPVTIKAGAKNEFTNSDIALIAQEIAVDERSHVLYLQTVLSKLGLPYIARPAVDLLNSFKSLGSLLGVPNFDPFASDIGFLLGGYIFEDVGVTAYKGASGLITNKTVLVNAAGVLAVEAYHAATLRTTLFGLRNVDVVPAGNGGPAITVAQATQGISGLRGMLGGESPDSNIPAMPEINDYGVASMNAKAGGNPPGSDAAAGIVVADFNSVAFSRTVPQVLKIVYADMGKTAPPAGYLATPGGFLPQGANGYFK